MQTMRDIKRKINSVENTKKITRAMKMVASAKLRKSQNRAEAAKPFFNKTKEVLSEVVSRMEVEKEEHPLLTEREEIDKVGYISITADRGLCGPYNSRIFKKTEECIDEQKDSRIIAIGKKGRNHFRREGLEIISEYLDTDDEPSYRWAKQITDEVISFYENRDIDKLHLIYTEFQNVFTQKVREIQLLPIKAKEIDEESLQSDYIYEPSANQVLERVIPSYMQNLIYGALLESKASEFASRMVAMDSATENAEEMIKDLTLSYNRARQAEITKEISEIVSGAEALD
ncbi:ATP synthase F1 subunit gamma [Fuchsiella alkaliacetigena]|uniref:ATP synthase F1 subunit gamma n=1 Tax=Fuchsiella alkaliacetigena TaxID=957042 RepID=UPI00200B8F5D|nr:ATP synthase F1 subunit gamma [Fuchsiella alkaliacetigena]MCK8824581.1 ATP synthase F1 subunit gamma [Fuchsiella alkaliacetigena]